MNKNAQNDRPATEQIAATSAGGAQEAPDRPGLPRARLAELEQRWASGNQVSTEDLRQNLRRYRSFFERLLEA